MFLFRKLINTFIRYTIGKNAQNIHKQAIDTCELRSSKLTLHVMGVQGDHNRVITVLLVIIKIVSKNTYLIATFNY